MIYSKYSIKLVLVIKINWWNITKRRSRDTWQRWPWNKIKLFFSSDCWHLETLISWPSCTVQWFIITRERFWRQLTKRQTNMNFSVTALLTSENIHLRVSTTVRRWQLWKQDCTRLRTPIYSSSTLHCCHNRLQLKFCRVSVYNVALRCCSRLPYTKKEEK